MVIGSLAQLWAVGAFILLLGVIYLSLIILKEDNSNQAQESTTSTSASGSASSFSSSPLPGKEVTPPQQREKEGDQPSYEGGSYD